MKYDKKNLDNIKLFILDMDGTIYLGDKLFDCTIPFFNTLESKGIKKVFMTNNSSKNKLIYKKKLEAMNIEVDLDEIFTSGEATAMMIAQEKPSATVHLLGNDNLKQDFESYDLKISSENPDYVVLGFDTTLTYDRIHKACDNIRAGAKFIATHPDLNCPLPEGKYMPDTGAMIKMFEAATDSSPFIVGKPNIEIINIILKKYGLAKNQVAMVGDRLNTDIKMANDANVTSILVLSGATTIEDLKESTIKPDIVVENIGGIYG